MAFLRARVVLLREWQSEGKSHEDMATLASCDAAQVASILRRTNGGSDAS